MLRSRLEALAREFVPGDGPLTVQRLGAGLVNTSCRVERGGRVYSLRLAESGSLVPGLDREWECRVLAAAAAAGVGPRICRCEPAAGVLVTDWVEGRAWSAAEAVLLESVAAVARLLRRVHSMPIPGVARRVDPAGWITAYHAAGANGPWSPALRGAARDQAAGAAPPGAVLCHGDVHRENLCVGNGLVLLDWEYAHVTDPFWDLAGWIANNDAPAPFVLAILEDYLGRPAVPAESDRLRRAVWLYDYVCLLWSELYLDRRRGRDADSQGAAEGVAARAVHLAERLGSGGLARQLPAH
jgi:aminoglycoside phosphotransferase (APT) family kinase protein